MTEPAWKGAGQAVGIQIWRIVKFKVISIINVICLTSCCWMHSLQCFFSQVTDWPKIDYGKFFSGDSYILLNTYQEKDSEVLVHACVYSVILF